MGDQINKRPSELLFGRFRAPGPYNYWASGHTENGVQNFRFQLIFLGYINGLVLNVDIFNIAIYI